MVEALKFLADQQGSLQQCLVQMAQQQANMMAGQQPKEKSWNEKNWNDIGLYKNIRVFAGDSREWEEFVEKFKSQVAAGSVLTANILDFTEAKMAEADLEEDDFATMIAVDGCDEDKVQEIGSKLHNLLLNLTTGEANAVVRRCRGRHGLLAWKKLCTSLNPRTLASGVKSISQALNPPKITDAKKADVAIEMWEDKLVKLDVEYGETLSSKMKVAVLYAMLPKDLQERVLDKCAVSWDRAKEADAALILGKVKEEVKNIAKSRRDMITPKMMEVDKVWAEWKEEEEPRDENDDSREDEGEVCYVGKGDKGKGKGKGACFTCGAYGHRAAECPNTGTGKGQKGKGKGGQKGWGQGQGWTQWPSWSPGQGAASTTRACFRCGSTAHMLRDCPAKTGKFKK